jgi:hypothetical protein
MFLSHKFSALNRVEGKGNPDATVFSASLRSMFINAALARAVEVHTTTVVKTAQRIPNSKLSHSLARITITICRNLFIVIETTLRFLFGQRHEAIATAANSRTIRPALNTLSVEVDHSIHHFEWLWFTSDGRLNASE